MDAQIDTNWDSAGGTSYRNPDAKKIRPAGRRRGWGVPGPQADRYLPFDSNRAQSNNQATFCNYPCRAGSTWSNHEVAGVSVDTLLPADGSNIGTWVSDGETRNV
jgi:hypothetical protein